MTQDLAVAHVVVGPELHACAYCVKYDLMMLHVLLPSASCGAVPFDWCWGRVRANASTVCGCCAFVWVCGLVREGHM